MEGGCGEYFIGAILCVLNILAAECRRSEYGPKSVLSSSTRHKQIQFIGEISVEFVIREQNSRWIGFEAVCPKKFNF